MRRTTLLTCLLLATACAVAGPAGAQGATTLATVPGPTVVAAAGGWTAWSEPDGSSFALVTRAPDGTVARPPVARRGVPFDLDLGADAAGRPVATYSRCATEPPESIGGLDERPSWRSGADAGSPSWT